MSCSFVLSQNLNVTLLIVGSDWDQVVQHTTTFHGPLALTIWLLEINNNIWCFLFYIWYVLKQIWRVRKYNWPICNSSDEFWITINEIHLKLSATQWTILNYIWQLLNYNWTGCRHNNVCRIIHITTLNKNKAFTIEVYCQYAPEPVIVRHITSTGITYT